MHVDCVVLLKYRGPCCIQIFPHHENELAQSQACACDSDRAQMANDGKDFVRFWMHNGFVNGALSCFVQLC